VRLKELLDGVEVLALRGESGVDVAALTHDSRRVQPGACFACVPGATTDGHAHAPEAVAAGAVALLVERELDLGVAEAEVPSVRRALGPAAARLHGHPSRALRCLGVTGTNGKTTTTYLLEAVARAAGERVGLVGTTGARVDGDEMPLSRTTPEATDLQDLLARMRAAGVGTVAMEVSSHALQQHRVDGTWFAAVGFTNLTHEHLDYHGTLEAYFEAKARLFRRSRTAAAAIGVDGSHGRDLLARARAEGLPAVTFGLDAPDADLGAEEIHLEAARTRFVLRDRRSGSTAGVDLALLGRFNVANALAAAAVSLAGGFDFDAVTRGLSSDLVVPGRLERVDAGQPFSVVVDYAHTPDALATVLSTGRSLAGPNRVIVVFGCGGDRDRDKRPLMGRAAAAGADLVVVTSDNPRNEDPGAIADDVLAGVRAGSAESVVELDRRLAIRTALRAAGPGDVVVLAGKGHEVEQTQGGMVRPFDDRAVARTELEVLAWS
jgi:UDP-N-acetylmuramoyl-L-alanyl-D-glutamate--2,6-diaminopimelate ligase